MTAMGKSPVSISNYDDFVTPPHSKSRNNQTSKHFESNNDKTQYQTHTLCLNTKDILQRSPTKKLPINNVSPSCPLITTPQLT